MVVDGDDWFEVAFDRGSLFVACFGEKSVGLHALPPDDEAIDERDMVLDAFVRVVGFKIVLCGDAPKIERLAQAAGGHAATGVFLGKARFDPFLLLGFRQLGDQAVVFPRQTFGAQREGDVARNVCVVLEGGEVETRCVDRELVGCCIDALLGEALGAEQALAIDEPVADDESDGTGGLADGCGQFAPFLEAQFAADLHADRADANLWIGKKDCCVHGI